MLESLANSQLKLKVELIDEGAVIDGFQKVANRITLGLVLASLIIGAAMMMPVESRFILFGYPGLPIILFLAARRRSQLRGHGQRPSKRRYRGSLSVLQPGQDNSRATHSKTC